MLNATDLEAMTTYIGVTVLSHNLLNTKELIPLRLSLTELSKRMYLKEQLIHVWLLITQLPSVAFQFRMQRDKKSIFRTLYLVNLISQVKDENIVFS